MCKGEKFCSSLKKSVEYKLIFELKPVEYQNSPWSGEKEWLDSFWDSDGGY